MRITLAHIGSPVRTGDPYGTLAASYLERSRAFSRLEAAVQRSEEQFLQWLDRQQGREPLVLVVLDSRGRPLTTDELTGWVRRHRDQGLQHLVFAIGPADGWSKAARERAQLQLSFGGVTMAHALARLVMAEQIYRVSTILTGHPYHSGH